MSLDGTYDGLKSAVAAWLDRDDLTAVIPDWIAMAESRLNDRLRLAAMERQLTLQPVEAPMTQGAAIVNPHTGAILTNPHTGAILTVGTGSGPTIGTVTLPSDFLQMRTFVALTTPPRAIKLADPAWASNAYLGRTNYPDVYTIVGSTLTLYPAATTLVVMTYYTRIPALSATNTANWLLTGHPQIYLYAALLEAVPYMYDDARATVWQTYLDTAIADAERADHGQRWSNAGVRISGATP